MLAFMNRPRPITVTVTAFVPLRSMSSRVTSNVVNAPDAARGDEHHQRFGGTAPGQMLDEVMGQPASGWPAIWSLISVTPTNG